MSGQEYTYSSKTFDNDNDKVYYQWDWDDGTTSDWEGPFYSGETVESSHTWSSSGTYQVKVKSKDIYEYESDWSDPLQVKIPRSRENVRSVIFRIIKQIQNTFPLFDFLFNL